MGVGAAIAGIGAVGSIAGGLISSGASSDAAQTQADAANQAAQLQEQQYKQTRNDLLPYNQSGQGWLGALNGNISTLTAPYSGAAPTFTPFSGQAFPQATPFSMTQAQLEQTPGYQFNLAQGTQAAQNSAAARGLGVSGAALKGATTFATGLADSTYQNQFNDYQQQYQNSINNYQQQFADYNQNYENQFNNYQQQFSNYQQQQTNAFSKLYNVASLGENAAAQTGNLGVQSAANAGNNITGAGNALAAGQVGSANALSGAINGLGGAASNYALYSQMGNGAWGSGGGGGGWD